MWAGCLGVASSPTSDWCLHMSCARAVQMATSCCNVYVACSKKVWGIFKLAKKNQLLHLFSCTAIQAEAEYMI